MGKEEDKALFETIKTDKFVLHSVFPTLSPI